MPGNQISRLFGNHDHRRIDIAPHEVGHHRRVDDAKIFRSNHTEFRINDGQRVGEQAHPAGTQRMVDRNPSGIDVSVDLGVGVSRGRKFVGDKTLQRTLPSNVSRDPYTGTKNLPILLCDQKILNNRWRDTGICRF